MVAVPDDYAKTVFFLCVDKVGNDGVSRRTPAATGFFVRVPLEGSQGLAVDYLVTARHCIEDARADGSDALYIRFNKKVGGFAEIETRIDDWLEHDSADVAAILALPSALPDGLTRADVEAASLKLAHFVGPGPDYKFEGESGGIGEVSIQPRVGHEIFFLGLFTEHAGSERNLLIARFGHIARMPDFIEIKHRDQQFKMIAYLVEFHSIGGHSGSPVFFCYPMTIGTPRRDEATETSWTQYDAGHVTGFMGLVAGHYPILSDTTPKTGDIQVKLNSGIAIITPACAVKELLMHDDFIEKRKRLRDEVEAQRPTPTLDFQSEEAFTRSDETNR